MTVFNLAREKSLTLSDRESACSLPLGQSPQANTWVKLLELPHPWSHDEALLLCQHSECEWVAWVPDYGETLLNTAQFC